MYVCVCVCVCTYLSPCKKVWFARWVELAIDEHIDMPTDESGEGAGSLQGIVTMDTGSIGSVRV